MVSCRRRPSLSFRSAWLASLVVCLTHLAFISAQTATELVTFTTGSASLNTPSKSAAPSGIATAATTRTAPALTSTTIPELQLDGPQVPFLLQKPIPAEANHPSRRVSSRMKDVYFTGCPADQVNYVDADLRLNISAVYTQFDTELGSTNHLSSHHPYHAGVLRIVAVGATNSQGSTVNTNVVPQLLSTLSVETQFLTFSVFRNDSYLCDSLYPLAPDPNGAVINGVVIQPAGCLYGPGQVSLGVGIPLNHTYTLGTLWTRIRLSDTSSPPLDIACIQVHASPYLEDMWYWRLIFWFPVALTIGYFVLLALGRIFCALTSRARAFKHKAREGSQPNVIKDTIAPTLVSSITGQKLALSAALLRFATPGCWDIIMHTQFVAAISMIAVPWPQFSYAFFKQAAWSTLTGNLTIIRPAMLDSQFDLLTTNATLPSGDISTQFSNTSSPLYMNERVPNRFMNLGGARAGMDAYAHLVGLPTRHLFGTCLSIWFFIVAAIVALSLLAWIVDSIHDTLLRLRKRREDGYNLDAADATVAVPETKEMVEADSQQARSSLSPRGGYRFLGTSARRLVGSNNNSFHLRMLHGNILRAIFLFHLPITIFTSHQMANADIFSATSVALAALAFAFLSILAPVYALFCISRAPTAKLYDSIGTLSAFGPIYNTYSPGSQLFCAVDLARTFVLGLVIGAGQASGSAQAIVLLIFEIMFALACSLWLPWGEGAMMGPVSFVASVLRIITAVLILLLSPLVDFGREPVAWLTYVILLIQAILYVSAALILVFKVLEGLVRLIGRASLDERASPRTSGLGGALRKIKQKKQTLQLNKNKGKRLSHTQQPLNRPASSNTQRLMLASVGKESSTGENTPAVPSSPRKLSTSLLSTAMSMNRMPMHSRQASYASYLDSQFQGRRSPADMLDNGNSPYSTYLRGDPHDEGYIMAALPPSVVANSRPVSPPPPHVHQWNGRQSPPPPQPSQSGFVRMGGGKATDAAPYQALRTGQPLTRPLSSGSMERMPPSQQYQALPPQHRQRPQSQNGNLDSYYEQQRRLSMPPQKPDEGVGSIEAAARNATVGRYSQGAQLRASQSIAGMMPVDKEGQPIQQTCHKSKGKFWKRGNGICSDSDSDDDDYADDGIGAYRSRGRWRGWNKMNAAMSSLAARLGGKGGDTAEQGNTSLEPPASEADVSGTRQGGGGFEVVRPQRPRKSSVAAERVLDSTALAAANAGVRQQQQGVQPSPTPTAVAPMGAGEASRSGSRAGMVSSAADAYSMPNYESHSHPSAIDDFDASSGTLPPGAAQQALLLPSSYRTSSSRPASTTLAQTTSSKPKLDEEMFWVSTTSSSTSSPLLPRPLSQPVSHSRPASTSSSRMMATVPSGSEARDSRQHVSTCPSRAKIAEPMQAEVMNAEEISDGSAGGGPMLGLDSNEGVVGRGGGSIFGGNGRLIEDAIDFDLRQYQTEEKRVVWDAAQAYNS